MWAFIGTTVFCLILWLGLTFTGRWWPVDELVAGGILSVVIGMVTRTIFIQDFKMAHPKRWLYFVAYLFPFFFEMTKANFDVAYRVITGRIKPGIVKLQPGLKSDIAMTMLANSITLTPGTLSVDIDDDNHLYVHWINVKDEALQEMPRPCQQVCSSFPAWIRKVAE